MLECPSAQQLERFRRNELSAVEKAVVTAHAEACPSCGAALGLRPTADVPTGDVPPRPEFVARLNALFHAPTPAEMPDIDGYEVLGEIGSGGMGRVWKVRDRRLGRLVALKTIRGDLDEKHRIRFRNEANAVAALRHPGIVPIYDVVETREQLCLVLELCPGGTLAERLRSAPLAPRVAAHLVKQLSSAVQAAHDARLIHRDLKPANVLFMASPDEPIDQAEPKITDFGLVKRLEDGPGLTQTGEILGTPSYLAPEQISSRAYGPIEQPTDTYALGAILYETLTRRPPFLAADPLQTLRQVESDDPLPVRRLQPTVPRDLESICMKCLEKKPAARYATAKALGEDLDRFLQGRPVRARAITWAYRLRRFVARNWRPIAVAACVLLLVAAGMSFWLAQKLQREAGLLARAVKLREDGLNHSARREEKEALRCFDEALRWLEQHPGASDLRRELAGLQEGLQGFVEARQRLETLETAFGRLQTSPKPARMDPRCDEIASEQIADCEKALAVGQVIDRADWADDAWVGRLNKEEQTRLHEAVAGLLELYGTIQQDSAVRCERLTGLGFQIREPDRHVASVLFVGGVPPNSNAARAGMRPGEKIVRVGGRFIPGVTRYEDIVPDFSGPPGSELSLLVVPVGAAEPREVRYRRSAEGKAELSMALWKQLIVQRVNPGSEAARAGVAPGDLLVSIQGQPAEGEYRTEGNRLSTRPLIAPFRLLSKTEDTNLTLVMLRADGRTPYVVTLPWDGQRRQALRRALVLYAAHYVPLMRGAALALQAGQQINGFEGAEPNASVETLLAQYLHNLTWIDREVAREAVAAAPVPRPRFSRALQLVAREKFQEAILEAQCELREHGQHSDSYLLIARCSERLGNWSAALTAWQGFVQLRPNYPMGYRGRAEALEHLGERELAEKDYQRALVLHPDYVEARKGLQRVRRQ